MTTLQRNLLTGMRNGDYVFNTDTLGVDYWYAGAWYSNASGISYYFAAVAITSGDVVRLSADDTVTQALADILTDAQVVGIALSGFSPGPVPGPVLTQFGQSGMALFESGLTLSAGENVYLSSSVAGALTNVLPTGPCIHKKVGVIEDASMYVDPGNLYAAVLLDVDQSFVIP